MTQLRHARQGRSRRPASVAGLLPVLGRPIRPSPGRSGSLPVWATAGLDPASDSDARPFDPEHLILERRWGPGSWTRPAVRSPALGPRWWSVVAAADVARVWVGEPAAGAGRWVPVGVPG